MIHYNYTRRQLEEKAVDLLKTKKAARYGSLFFIMASPRNSKQCHPGKSGNPQISLSSFYLYLVLGLFL